MRNSSMNVAGVMSGTSADGIDVALAHIHGKGWNTRIRLLAHRHFAFPNAVRKTILQLANTDSASAADFARMNFLLAELYATAVKKTLRTTNLKIELAGCHGQTLYHQGEARNFLGEKISCTWQSGEGAVLAAR